MATLTKRDPVTVKKHVWAQPAKYEHIAPIAEDMRDTEFKTVIEFDHTPFQAFEESLNDSLFAYTIMLGDKPVGMFGIVRITPNLSNAWVMCANGFDLCNRWLLRNTDTFLHEMFDHATTLASLVDSRYQKTMRWMSWAGFTTDFKAYYPNAKRDVPFYIFRAERDDFRNRRFR